jgi:DNA polymerase III epsilon subunit-like protein
MRCAPATGSIAATAPRHGALLDAELLAQVYVELTGGRQIGLSLVADASDTLVQPVAAPARERTFRPARPHRGERGGTGGTCRLSRNGEVSAMEQLSRFLRLRQEKV